MIGFPPFIKLKMRDEALEEKEKLLEESYCHESLITRRQQTTPKRRLMRRVT
jgi:hypothetical protein